MKFIHFAWAQTSRWGILEGSEVVEISGNPYGRWNATRQTHPLADLKILSPCNASKMFVVGWNYAEHAHETGDEAPKYPQFYPLAASSIIAHHEPVIYPRGIVRVDHEAELVVVIGREGRGISAKDAEDYIAGFTCGNDVSARDFQWDPDDKNIPRAKTVDTFSPVGPVLVTEIDYQNLDIEMRVNGEVRQSSNTNKMVFYVPQLIAAISKYITLFPGDVIFSGTPQGISPVKIGDLMEVKIEGIGTLSNPVIDEAG